MGFNSGFKVLIYDGITLPSPRISIYSACVTLSTLPFVQIVYLCVSCDSYPVLMMLTCWPKTVGLCRKIQSLLVAGMEVRLEVNAQKVALYFHVSSKRIRDTIIT